MDRLSTPIGATVQRASDMQFLQDAIKTTISHILSNRTAVEPMFIISGVNADVDEPEEGDVTVTVEEGVICWNGEPIPVPAQSETHDPSDVHYFVLEEVGVDTTPVNVQGQSVNVKRHRYAKLTVGSNYPAADQHCKVDAPTMNDINLELLGTRSMRALDMVPTNMTITEVQAWYDASGLGIAGTPGEGRAICNGLNGTPMMHGLGAVGAVNGVPNGGQPLPDGVAKNWNIGEVFGEEEHELTDGELPELSLEYSKPDYNLGANYGAMSGTPEDVDLSTQTTPESIDLGSGEAHNNIQPMRALVWVMILP